MRIGFIGTGTWGTATACMALRSPAVDTVLLWGRDPDKVAALRESRQHPKLSDHRIPDQLLLTSTDADLSNCDALFWAVPTQHSRAILERLRPHIDTGKPLVNCSKGIEEDSMLRLSEIFTDVLGPGCYGCLTGPSHAEEALSELPCALVVAGPPAAQEVTLQAFHHGTTRIYTSTDLIGVELGGAVKNVIAIAAGICDGLELGDNCKAALITRGTAEIARLGQALGAEATTFAGLAGIGDLLTTCYSPYGRNRALGFALAAGTTLEEHLAETGMVAEGAYTCRSTVALGDRHGVELPIASQVASMLWDAKPVREALTALINRSTKDEFA